MIESLRIRNLAVVEEVRVDFVPGLNVLTGETGAGKSLILGALALLTGSRASSLGVRSGAPNASVEAILSTADLSDLEKELSERGVVCEDHSVVVSRTVSAEGRSRAQIGGQWVAVSALRELFDGRLEISSQHASQALRRREEHANFLDDFGGLSGLSKELIERYEELRRNRAELEALRGAEAQRERQHDFLRFQRDEIDDAGVAPGEIASLDAEQRQLAHAEELARGRHQSAEALNGDDPQRGSALAHVERSAAEIEALVSVDPGLAPLLERLQGLREEIADLALELGRGADRAELDPARLEVVEARIGLIEGLRRKYGVDEAAIAAHRDRVEAELRVLGTDAGRAEELDSACDEAARALAELAKKLSGKRARAAKTLAREVERALASLEMEGARFEVALTEVPPAEGLPCGPHGAEQVEFRLGANAGEPTRPLAKVASGGELSRIFLALMRARLQGGGTQHRDARMMVFDEVDTGIGGRAIDQVGVLLQELGAHHQVFCITHWPQIAAAASGHHRVQKTRRGARTQTAVEALEDDERVEELARMAGGAKVTAATRRHAREMLDKRSPEAPPAKPRHRGGLRGGRPRGSAKQKTPDSPGA